MNGMGSVILAALVSVIAGGLVGWLLNNRFGARSLEAMQKLTKECHCSGFHDISGAGWQ